MDANNRVLVFDVWGNYAHFRRFFTTSSPLSFPFPPRTTVTGLIAAIIGLGREVYISALNKDHANIAVRVVNPVKKTTIAQNFINTKHNYITPVKRGKHYPRTPTRVELMKDCKYRIYFTHTNIDTYELVKEFLRDHKSVYTPYLGASEYLCNFKFVGEKLAEQQQNGGFVEIVSVIPTTQVEEIDFNHSNDNQTGAYFTTTIPVNMQPDRTVDEFAEVLYERNGYPIKVKVKTHWLLTPMDRSIGNNGDNTERICFL